jgi:hypothetical protein
MTCLNQTQKVYTGFDTYVFIEDKLFIVTEGPTDENERKDSAMSMVKQLREIREIMNIYESPLILYYKAEAKRAEEEARRAMEQFAYNERMFQLEDQKRQHKFDDVKNMIAMSKRINQLKKMLNDRQGELDLMSVNDYSTDPEYSSISAELDELLSAISAELDKLLSEIQTQTR